MCLSSHPFHFFVLIISKKCDAFRYSAVSMLFVCVSVNFAPSWWVNCIAFVADVYGGMEKQFWEGKTEAEGEISVSELLFLLQIAAVSERNLNLASAETGRPACKLLRHGKTNLALTAIRSIQIQASVHSPVQEKACVQGSDLEHVKFPWRPSQIVCDVMEVPSSSLVEVTACLDSVLMCFSSFSPNKLWKATEIMSRRLSSTHFLAYYPSVIPLLTPYSLR